jgi:hypothetical protein
LKDSEPLHRAWALSGRRLADGDSDKTARIWRKLAGNDVANGVHSEVCDLFIGVVVGQLNSRQADAHV